MRKGSRIQSGKTMFYGDDSYQGNYLCVVLKEPVRLDVLQRSVDKAVRTHPWVCYGAQEDAGEWYYHDDLEHSLTVSEFAGNTLPDLGGDAAREHLMGVHYQGNAIYFSTFHGLTDGVGEFMFSHEVLSWYASEVLGVPYDGTSPAKDMDADPFEVLDDVLARAGMTDVAVDGMGGLSEEFLIEEELQSTGDEADRHILARMSAQDFMAFANREHVKASAALCALYAAAVLAVHPYSSKPLRVAVPADMRSVLGIPGTHRNAAMPPLMLQIDDCADTSVHELAQRFNQLIMERSSDPAKLLSMKGMRGYQAMMPALPFVQMEQIMAAQTSDGPLFTFNCTYVHRYTSEIFLPLVEDAYIFAPAYGRGTVLAAIALPNHFTLMFNQGGETQAYVDAFVGQLRAEDIDVSLAKRTPVQGAYVALRETLGLKAGDVTSRD